MDNMKARSFVESEMPLPGTLDAERQKTLDVLALQCVSAAVHVADILRGSVREALFGKGTVSVDVTLLSNVRERFWAKTENSFFAILQDATGIDDEGMVALRKSWLQILAQSALGEFDATVILEPDTGITEAQRSALARRRLGAAVSGRGKEGEKIWSELGFPKLVKKKQKIAEKVS